MLEARSNVVLLAAYQTSFLVLLLTRVMQLYHHHHDHLIDPHETHDGNTHKSSCAHLDIAYGTSHCSSWRPGSVLPRRMQNKGERQ